MNVLFVWTGVTGYMGDAWRALAQERGVRLKVLILERRGEPTRFDQAVTLRDIDCTVVYDDERLEDSRLDGQVRRFAPEVIFIVGWRAKLSRHFALRREFSHVPKVLVFDLPFEWSLKKLAAPFVLRPYLRHFCGCFVPGARAAEYARWLGFKDGQGLGWIEKGLFCVNVVKLSGVAEERRKAGAYPRTFLFVGRYVKEKGIDVLMKAYCRYRMLAEARGDSPWGLTCCGMGPLAPMLRGVPGVSDICFQQPDELPNVFLSHGAFVIASLHEPWGVVIAEAAAVGLPIICTRACGASLDVVDGNGIVCETGDVEGMAQAMVHLHQMSDAAKTKMGDKGLTLAANYSCEAWASRVVAMLARINREGGAASCLGK